MKALKITLICCLAGSTLTILSGMLRTFEWNHIGPLALMGIFLGLMAAPTIDEESFKYPSTQETLSGLIAGALIGFRESEDFTSLLIGASVGAAVGFLAPLWIRGLSLP